LDFGRELDHIGEDVVAALERVVDNGWFVLGSEVESFETRFAEYVKTGHCVGVNSGTDAIELSLRALGVEAGDRVVTVAHTATATAAAIRSIGADPVYVDVDPETMVMDVEAAADAITDRVAAVVPVHLYGHPVDMDPLLEFAAEHEIAVLEDCSQAHGATYRGAPVGSLGDAAAFSFYPTKNLGAYGDAGAVVTDDPTLAESVERLRQYGWETQYDPQSWGRNSRLDEMQAAILNIKLDRLPEWTDRRRAVADRYDELLSDASVMTPVRTDDVTHVFHQYVVRADRRDCLRDHLDRNGVDTLIHYPTPVHRQPGYHSDVSLPVTEQLCERIVSLPINPFLSPSEINRVAAAVVAFD
jgi:dTDP-4-amino-4,6-dideoxygalactose transaminase